MFDTNILGGFSMKFIVSLMLLAMPAVMGYAGDDTKKRAKISGA